MVLPERNDQTVVKLGGGFKAFIEFSALLGEMIQFWRGHISQMGGSTKTWQGVSPGNGPDFAIGRIWRKRMMHFWSVNIKWKAPSQHSEGG